MNNYLNAQIVLWKELMITVTHTFLKKSPSEHSLFYPLSPGTSDKK